MLIPKALGSSIATTKCDSSKSGSSMRITDFGDATIEMTTIDHEIKQRNIDVGFIKIDVEGYGMPVITGAIQTIKSQRPVLSIGLYHNNEELFGIKPFLERHLENYVYEFHLEQFVVGDFNEMTLFCYPKEILH